MMYLVHLTSVGLVLDIIGFLLVYMNRRVIATISNRAPRDDEGKDGDCWLEDPGLSAEEARKTQEKQRREQCLLLIGGVTVVFGFGLQLIGSIVSNLHLAD